MFKFIDRQLSAGGAAGVLTIAGIAVVGVVLAQSFGVFDWVGKAVKQVRSTVTGATRAA